MKKNRIKAVVMAAALPLTLCSCSLENFGYDDPEDANEADTAVINTGFEYESPDLDEVNEKVKELLKEVKQPNNEKKIKGLIEELLDYVDIASDAASYSSVDSNLNWYDETLEYQYEDMTENYYVIRSAVEFAFSKGYKSEYSELFKEYIDEESLEYFVQKGMTLVRVEAYSAVDYRLSDEEIDDYFEIAYDDSLSDDEKNLKCAEVYLDVLGNYDPETFYDNYYRDYSPKDIKKLSKTVRNELIPLSERIEKILKNSDDLEKITDNKEVVEAPFETIREYSGKLSENIKRSADKINDEGLYTIATGDKSYTGSYTMGLPSQNSALVYIYSDDSYNTLSTAIHEFGHFHSTLSDKTRACLSVSNIDIAEIQSQAMELLFMKFYDEIYGEQADLMKLMLAGDMTDAIISSFLIGEFEYTVLTQADELEAEDVLELYDEILGSYAEYYPFYYVNHIFEYPGYYISYGVSALAALDIFDEAAAGDEEAVEKYEKISAVPSNSKDVRFKTTLKECGFSNVLTDKYVKSIAKELSEFTDKVSV